MKPRLLIFADYYLPGFRAGGPIASISRIVASRRHDYDISIITRDRDLGDTKAYDSIQPSEWNSREGISVFYALEEQITTDRILSEIRNVDPAIIYLNSYFSKFSRLVLRLRRYGKLPGIRILVAPRGEFSPGALSLKSAKKKSYLAFANYTGLHWGVSWHASAEMEKRDIVQVIGESADVVVEAPHVEIATAADLANVVKHPGYADFAWLSRISPKKNLLGAIELLGHCNGNVALHIYGPIEDEAYWGKCRAAIEKLPGNVRVRHHGAIAPTDVAKTLSAHHFFLFPTFGENFGHVIAEALSAGCPVLLSDQTPWGDVTSNQAGWSIRLESPDWISKIQNCIDMHDPDYQAMRAAARNYLAAINANRSENSSADIFNRLLAA